MKSLKPIDVDAYFKYRCPHPNCGQNHWLTLKETQVKKFKIACECGNILTPKRISKLKIKYILDSKIIEQTTENKTDDKTTHRDILEPPISDRLLVICSKTLIDYGFTSKEAENLLKQNYILNPTDNPLELINNTLKMIGNTSDATTATN